MCGIIGWINDSDRWSNVEQYLWKELCARGDYSHGFVTLSESEFILYKGVGFPEQIPTQFMLRGTTLAQVRAPTTPDGMSAFTWDENHPFVYGDAILAMNGIIEPVHLASLRDERVQNDTYYLLKGIVQKGWGFLSEVKAVFACWMIRAGKVYLFRSTYPLFFSAKHQMFSSIPFEDAELIPEHMVFEWAGDKLNTVMAFHGQHRPYFFAT